MWPSSGLKRPGSFEVLFCLHQHTFEQNWLYIKLPKWVGMPDPGCVVLEEILLSFVKAGIYPRGSNVHNNSAKCQELGDAQYKESLMLAAGQERG